MKRNRRAPRPGVDMFSRAAHMGAVLERGGYWSVQDIMALFGVSHATAKRDLVALEAIWPIRRELLGSQRELLYFRADRPRPTR